MYKMQKIITNGEKQTIVYIEGPDPYVVIDLYHEAMADTEEIMESDEEQEEETIECPHCGSDNIQETTQSGNEFYCLDCKKKFHE